MRKVAKKSKPEPEPEEEEITEEEESLEVAELLELENIEINEVKHNTFLRLAKPRTQKVIKSLIILGNCANKSSYAYYPEEVEKMFYSIRVATDDMEAKFQEKLKDQKELFDF